MIRRDTDYALRAVLALAGVEGGKASVSDLAMSSGIPRSFAHKILRKMCDKGLVASCAGRNGGFHLRREPTQISLLDITDAVQGRVTVSRCVSHPATCANSGRCPARRAWVRAEREIVRVLSRTTVHDLLKAGRRPRAGTKA